MSTNDNYHFLIITLMILFVLNDYCFCMSESFNISHKAFSSAIATWYGAPNGPGRGACGYGNDVTNFPYNSLVSAGNNFLFKSGAGCGACYQVKCTNNPACSGFPITVVITDECPGSCNSDPVHFDLSGKAIGYLAKPGQAGALCGARRINIEYQKVPCSYKASITFKIDLGANPFFVALAIENVNGDGELGYVELFPSNSKSWVPMQRSFGATWKANLPFGGKGPFSVRLTSLESKKTIVAFNAIPANWAPGKYYISNVNF
ncbi:hypothetical protein CDL12_22719 [Handroanthus impetiginosus]|uniref:Expansin-like EG45 domain-containing protein n=1 Tax=Handroanthus impetiginosus TaxID=429701 RepID=A0A2G9GHH9_9LAMI|nr:hypothetical protein CDL12_22719 [Handroanthus impetiginosus]